MRSFRRAVSEKLLESGARLALDRQQMVLDYVGSGARRFTAGDLQVLSAIDLWSTVAIRLGRILMPARPPISDWEPTDAKS